MTTAAEMQADEARRRTAVRRLIWEALEEELEHAYRVHGAAPWGRHEAYAITLEELDEAWDEIKADGPAANVAHELLQTAAMCIRYLEQAGDRYAASTPPFQHPDVGHEAYPHRHDWRGEPRRCTTPGCYAAPLERTARP